MIDVLWVFLGLVLIKVVLNLVGLLWCRSYLDRYDRWLRDPKEGEDWRLVECKSQVRKLFNRAGVQDKAVAVVEPVAQGGGRMWVRSGQASVVEQFPNRIRADIIGLTGVMFHEAIGVYRSRVLEAVNPLYWLDFVVFLPREVAIYFGVSPDRVAVKVAQVVWWVVDLVLGFLLAVLKPDIVGYIRRLFGLSP